eukprot:5439882-Pyramimonas_sp.AAC.1
MSDADFRTKHEIRVKGDAVPAPFQRFEDANFPVAVQKALDSAGFSAPSAIQVRGRTLGRHRFAGTYGPQYITAVVLMRCALRRSACQCVSAQAWPIALAGRDCLAIAKVRASPYNRWQIGKRCTPSATYC